MPLVQILILGLERGEHVEILIFGKPTQITGYHFTNIYFYAQYSKCIYQCTLEILRLSDDNGINNASLPHCKFKH